MSRPAFIAASQCADALTALLVHADEECGFGDMPVVEKLAEAIIHAIDIQLGQVEPCDAEYREHLGQLRAMAARFIEAWAG